MRSEEDSRNSTKKQLTIQDVSNHNYVLNPCFQPIQSKVQGANRFFITGKVSRHNYVTYTDELSLFLFTKKKEKKMLSMSYLARRLLESLKKRQLSLFPSIKRQKYHDARYLARDYWQNWHNYGEIPRPRLIHSGSSNIVEG